MKRIVSIVLLTLLPAIAQKQKEPDWDKENDDYAIAYYRDAEQGRSYAGFLYQEFNGKDTCPFAVGYSNMSWVVERAAKRPKTLGKIGITPESAKILRAKFGSVLVKNLYDRVKQNKPLQGPCMFHVGGAGPMVGTAIFDLGTIFQVIDHLEFILDENPDIGKDIPRAELREPWKKSVISAAAKLKTRCEDDLKYDGDNWRKYARECKVLVKALEAGVAPATLKLNAAMVARLRSPTNK